MKLLDKLVLKDILPMFFIGTMMFFSLWFAGGPVLLAIKLLGLGFSPLIIIKVIGWSIPPVLALTFPMGMLLAALIGFGRLSAESEAVALFAGGIPFVRIAMPAFVLAVIVSIAGFVVNDQLASIAHKRLNEIQSNLPDNLGETTHAFTLDDHYKNGALRTLVHVEKGYDFAKRELRQVTITVYGPDGKYPTALVFADRAKWQYGKSWHLSNEKGYLLGDMPAAQTFGELELLTPEAVALNQDDPDNLNFRQLYGRIRGVKSGPGDIYADTRGAEVSLWSKLALPLASFTFAMIGVPLGLQPQRSSKFIGWILAVLIIFAYYVLYTVMSSVARATAFPPLLAVFLPNIVGFLAGAYLIWKRSTA